MKVLFLPSSTNGLGAVDRRRFLAFQSAEKSFSFTFNPKEQYDLIFCAGSGDINLAIKLRESGKPLIYDYANHYLVEDNFYKNIFRPIYFSLHKRHKYCFKSFKNSIIRIIRNSDAVVCSSQQQKIYIKSKVNYHNTTVLTDFFEFDFPFLFRKENNLKIENKNALFWEGQAENLINFKSINKTIFEKESMNLVTDLSYRDGLFRRSTKLYCDRIFKNYNLLNWNQSNVKYLSQKSDIAIIPIDTDIPIYYAKPENKVILMFLLGLPVITSSIPSYQNILCQTGISNLLITQERCWGDAIHDLRMMSLKNQVDLKLGLRDFALKNYSTSSLKTRWKTLFEKVISANSVST
ncbi:hypothetical protein OAV71_05770 [Opitutales bacterium]|nr:hypothetical protein [Opitutales bacterium]